MSTVLSFPATGTMTPSQALASAMAFAEQRGLQDVLVVGYDDDGDLFIRSSRMNRKDALWLAEQLKLYALYTE